MISRDDHFDLYDIVEIEQGIGCEALPPRWNAWAILAESLLATVKTHQVTHCLWSRWTIEVQGLVVGLFSKLV